MNTSKTLYFDYNNYHKESDLLYIFKFIHFYISLFTFYSLDSLHHILPSSKYIEIKIYTSRTQLK